MNGIVGIRAGNSLILIRIYANDGSCIQVVTSQQLAMVVYGGTIMRTLSRVPGGGCYAN
jgi:hypothetical protein